jgi:DNA-binding FadR family transcriptional regulator
MRQEQPSLVVVPYRELQEFRSIFEPEVTAYAAANANEGDIAKLRSVLQVLEQALAVRDATRLGGGRRPVSSHFGRHSHNALMIAVASGLNILCSTVHESDARRSQREKLSNASVGLPGGGRTYDQVQAEAAMAQQMATTRISEGKV